MKQLILIFLIALLGLGTSYAAPPEADHPGDEITLSADQSIDDVSFITIVTGVAIAPIRAVDPVLLSQLSNPPAMYTAGISLPEELNWTSILNVALFIASVTLGGGLMIFKKKGRDVANALNTILDAVEDNSISTDEEKEIAASIRKIFKK